jgi:hypothetical protein
MRRSALAAIALFCLGTAAPAQNFSAVDLEQRTIHRRAVEAVIWGMPAVNYDLMFQAMVKAGGNENQIVYWSRLVDSKNQTLTNDPARSASRGALRSQPAWRRDRG